MKRVMTKHWAPRKVWTRGLNFLSLYVSFWLHFVKVWVAAAAQNFNSIGIAFGSMIALSSYNKFHSNTLLRDTFLVSLLNSATSIFASFVIFSVIGYIAHVQGADVEDVVTDGKTKHIFKIAGPKCTLTNAQHIRELWLCYLLCRFVTVGS